jgi:hypothetical protein
VPLTVDLGLVDTMKPDLVDTMDLDLMDRMDMVDTAVTGGTGAVVIGIIGIADDC